MQLLMDKKNGYYRVYLEEITSEDLLPGALALLKKLQAMQYRLALASASRNAKTVVSRLGIESCFEVIADGKSVKKTKPAPDIFLFAARQLSLPPQACLVIEDAEAGIAAAKAAGMTTIGIGPVERVGAADHIYPSVAAIRLAEII